MKPEDTEYRALKHLSKADRHYRIVVYLLTGIFFGTLIYLLVNIRDQINNRMGELSKTATAKTQEIIKDGITRDKETTRYITCIFVIPIEQRTPEKQQECFDIADQPGGLSRDDFSPYVSNTSDSVVQSTVQTSLNQPSSTSSGVSSRSSSPNSSPQPSPLQQDTSQNENIVQKTYKSILKFMRDLF